MSNTDRASGAKGLLLLNLGTPDSPEKGDVRKYLAEFLMDPYVIDIPWIARLAMVYGLVLPFRPKKSSEAYKKVWAPRGSPLLIHLEDLAAKVSRLAPEYRVAVAMRYQSPDVRCALEKLRAEGARELVVFPLYPQYSLAATESSIAKVRAEAKKIGFTGKIHFIPPFYAHPAFETAFAASAREALEELRPDYVLFSFHGLPERQVCRPVDGAHCTFDSACCERVGESNRDCYRAQCFATAHAIARRLDFSPEAFGTRYGVSFQSRLGRTPWIRPYTDVVLPELVKAGVKKLAVVCPSFVADCLETLEEIAIRGREQFRAAGGTELVLVPSLNARDDWAQGALEIVQSFEQAQGIQRAKEAVEE